MNEERALELELKYRQLEDAFLIQNAYLYDYKLTLEKYKEEIIKLKKESLLLQALEECGVDNWDGYTGAKRLYKEWADK